MKNIDRRFSTAALLLTAAISLTTFYMTTGVEAQSGAPRYVFDPTWPKPLPNNWKMGGVTGLAVDKDDNVWVLNRPNDTTDQEDNAATNPPTAHCCVKPPTMIHISKTGDVIGSFDAPQGHGMDVDSQGFVYIGQDTVRKYEPKSGKMVKELPRVPESQPQGGGGRGRGNVDPAEQAKAVAAFRAKYPPTTPQIVGQIEEIRLDEKAREMYVADSYLGGRVMIYDLDTFAFKRGWGAYGKPLAQIRANDGLVYAADRNANRIHVTDKQGKFIKEFVMAPETGEGGSTGGVAFSQDPQQRFLIISDLTNNHILFLNRADGKVLERMGSMGDNGGQWYGLHMIAIDSQGNIYTGEVQNGERVQRFVPADSPRGKLLAQLAGMR